MANTERLRLLVDLDPDARPISGHVAAGSGPEQAFVGWTELFAVLQAVVAERDRGSAPQPGSP
ncbi:MAG TPA: hypothetical protein VIB48_21900 [Acidimicrobiia bacterium]|jgi:hypothetical protein